MVKHNDSPHQRAAGSGPSRTLMRTNAVLLGEFRCAPTDADFAQAGQVRRHCFVFPRRGVWIEHEGTPPFVADSTRVVLYNPRQSYERRMLHPAGDHSDWIGVSESLAREVVAYYDSRAADSPHVFRHSHTAASADLYLEQRRLYEYVRRCAAPDPLLVEEFAIGLFGKTIAATYAKTGAPSAVRLPDNRRHRDTVEDARAYLNLTLRETVSVSTIAEAVGVSVYHLCRIFRRATRDSLTAYRHHLRLRWALEHLDPRTDLLALALDLGYSGHSHFTSMFRREFGLTPSDLRGWTSKAHVAWLRTRSRRMSRKMLISREPSGS